MPSPLFGYYSKKDAEQQAPLAARMRPQTLEEFWGQKHILAPGRLLRRAIEADQLSSVIFYGPPGTGKTTLARIIANTTQARFLSLNAVLAGVKDIRESIEIAKQTFELNRKKCILFVDEVHRFNKSQQDALLPWVENGTIVLIGATTENPYFEVNKALVSRSRIFQLLPLTEDDLRAIARQALASSDRGYGNLNVILRNEALDHLVNVANGDARALLNALELAVVTTPTNADGIIDITLMVAEESIQQRAVLYDKEGDAHFDTISAFIKSVRGSDPDAALYWLARMVLAGESPNFILRRLLILACEDIGLADPHAIAVVQACAQAFDRIGMPEGRYHLAHATLYLSTAPKSNSSMAFFDALATVEKEVNKEVPNHLKDASRDKADFGHGDGYLYPHAYRDHWVAQQYLPTELQGRIFYHPTTIGYEANIAVQVEQKREAQLAGLDEQNASILNNINTKGEESWIGRTVEGAGQRAELIRNHIFNLAEPVENSRYLDINTGTGLLAWEALRRLKTGSLTACFANSAQAGVFEQQARQNLDIIEQPNVVTAEEGFENFMRQWKPSHAFDVIIGRNCLQNNQNLSESIHQMMRWLDPGGVCVLAHALPASSPRIYALAPLTGHDRYWYDAWKDAEDAMIREDPQFAFTAQSLERAAQKCGYSTTTQYLELNGALHISDSLFSRWFTLTKDGKDSYAERLRGFLTDDTLQSIIQWALIHLKNKTFPWPTCVAITKWTIPLNSGEL